MTSLPFSFELFPPREAPEDFDVALEALLAAHPAFVSVTYGAAGTTRDRTLALVQRVLDAGANPMAHLTCVGLTAREASSLVRQFLDAGITRFLALRGDPPLDGPDELGDLRSAGELVQLIQRVEAERAPYSEIRLGAGSVVRARRRSVEIAVAAFPNGHPGSGSARTDIDALLAKQAAGASMAITQLFFDPDHYARFVDLARARGVTIPIVPGILIPTSVRRLDRAAALAGERPPSAIRSRLASASPVDAERVGVDVTVALIDALVDIGIPGIHLYTFNRHVAALEVLRGVGAIEGASA